VPDDIMELRGQYPNAAVICYVNTSAAVKAVCDVCCTSSSAESIVRNISENQIIFVPDRNLGAYIASKVPEKEIILFDGWCPPHDCVTEKDVFQAKSLYPDAKLLVHPECRVEIQRLADYIGSTAGIINEALTSDAGEFIIGTEIGVIEHLKNLSSAKKIYPLKRDFLCVDMKKTTLSDVLKSLETEQFEISLAVKDMNLARQSLEKMISLSHSSQKLHN